MVSYAAGLSYGGITPILYSITPFITERVAEQIKLDVSYNQNKVIFISAGSTCDYTDLGPTHHCPNDMNIICSYPDIKWHTPFDDEDAVIAIRNSLRAEDNASHYIRLSSETSSSKRKEGEIKKKVSKQEICLDLGPDSKYIEIERDKDMIIKKITNERDLQKELKNAIEDKDIKRVNIRCPFVMPRRIYKQLITVSRRSVEKDWFVYDTEQVYIDACVTKYEYYKTVTQVTQL